MRSVLLIVFIFLATLVQAADEFIVVATPLSATLSNKSCDDYTENDLNSKFQEVCMDRVFNISYQILGVLSGSYNGKTIHAIDFYHYSGLPDHMIIDPACVRFREYRGEYVHVESVPAKKAKSGYVCEST